MQIIKKISLLTVFILVWAWNACSKDDTSVEPEIVLSVESVTFARGAAYKSVDIQSNVAFTVSSSASWCTVTPQSGTSKNKVIKISAETNATPDVRHAVVTIASGSYVKEIAVEQALTETLILKQTQFELPREGGELTLAYQTTGTAQLTLSAGWMAIQTNKSLIDHSVVLSVSPNNSLVTRTGTIEVKLGTLTETATVTQQGVDLWVEADQTGVERNATALAAQMKLGWNLGNSLEAIGSETAWGNPKTTKALIDAVKAAGFDAVRIPCSWSSYLEDEVDYRIQDAWINRVKEVVDYCIDNQMYAIINIHWDGGWLENHPLYSEQEAINKKQKALWNQIAVYFRNYDEHLLFAGTNEVHFDYNTPTAEHLAVQMSFNQTFVDAVRETGGKNAYRNLIVQSYNTNINYGYEHLELPVDAVRDRLFAEVHYYDPWDFCGDTGSGYKYLWGAAYAGMPGVATWGLESYLETQFHKMKTQFADRGVPVILGEFGAMYRKNLPEAELLKHRESRNYYLKSVVKKALEKGMVPFYWDNGGLGDNGFGLFNRSAATVEYSDAVNAMLEGAGKK